MKNILYIILFIFLFIIISSIINYNPHKLILVLGKKGSGKSILEVKKMIHYLKRGWNVYTDIPDCKIQDVKVIDPHDLEYYTPVKHSAIFLDEVGLTFDNRKFKEFADGINQWFKLQRKYKCVVYVNSQGMDIDLKLRLLLDGMILMTPLFNTFALMRPIKKVVKLTDPIGDSESKVADALKFQSIFNWRLIYMPKYYKYFDSYSAPQREEIPYKLITNGYKIHLKPIPFIIKKIKNLKK